MDLPFQSFVAPYDNIHLYHIMNFFHSIFGLTLPKVGDFATTVRQWVQHTQVKGFIVRPTNGSIIELYSCPPEQRPSSCDVSFCFTSWHRRMKKNSNFILTECRKWKKERNVEEKRNIEKTNSRNSEAMQFSNNSSMAGKSCQEKNSLSKTLCHSGNHRPFIWPSLYIPQYLTWEQENFNKIFYYSFLSTKSVFVK